MKLWGGKRPRPTGKRQRQDTAQPEDRAFYTETEDERMYLQREWEKDWQEAAKAPSFENTEFYFPDEELTEAPKKKKHRVKTLAVFALTLAIFYCVAVFSNIPFIRKWRTIYIETAMSTMTHQWLATAFLPNSVIQKVMGERVDLDAEQSGVSSDWEMSDLPGADQSLPWDSAQDTFFKVYPEIDSDSFKAYAKKHADEILNKDHYLMIDKAGLSDGGTSIKTVHGDEVLAIDTVNGISIIKIKGEGYVARLAIIKDPGQVFVGTAKSFRSVGQTAGEICERYGGVLAINASGFADPNGHGNGGTPYGLVISEGNALNNLVGNTYKTIAFDKKDKLNVGNFKSTKNFRDAVEFKPALIINGKKLVEGSSGWGIQPRSAIGQTKDGQVLMLIVDGRAAGYSLGCTVGDLADIMARYGAVQACNLDGGSSSVLYYNGREISKPSAANKVNGRRLPDAFVVSKK